MGSYWRLSRNIQVIKVLCVLLLSIAQRAPSLNAWRIQISMPFPFSVGSSSSRCWFSSMSLVLHSTEIWLGMRQTPVEWRTTEPMDRPYFPQKTQASLSHVNKPFREARLVHLRCLNRMEEAQNCNRCLWGCYGLELSLALLFPPPIAPIFIHC